jgi:D-3-phosphoglycerate dehydrogenase
MRIVLCYDATASHLKAIAAAAPGAEIVAVGQDGLAEAILTADVFCGHAKVPVPWREVVDRGRLNWIQSSAAGIDHCLVPPVVESNIVVTSASGLFADSVAEQTLALLLGLLRGLPVFFRAAQRGEFIRRPTRDLHGACIGIVGFGGNGRRIAEVLAAFRTRILATDVFTDDRPPHVEQLLPPERLGELLPQVDVLIITVPLTEQTRGMIDAAALARMKRGALLVNVARGPVVVEADLVEALRSGQLSGAGLDVTEVEPLPEGSPLWLLENVIITPHVGAQSGRRNDNVTELFCENLRRFARGEALCNVVDKGLGFPTPADRQRMFT